jgi:4-diphosphocytidyl-2-C-methyl-D-erythritol kinase
MRTMTVRPTAKVNFTLDVGPRRPDGYHEVCTLMQSIGVADTLVFSERKGPFALQSRAPGVPTDESNLVWKAARALWSAAGKTGEPRDVHVRLDKAIPAQAGLGGGSADAAAALVALNALWNCKLPRRELIQLASGLGSDVPFFLVGGAVLAAGRGDELYPLEDVSRLGVVVIKPSFGVSTADAYRWLDEDRDASRHTPATTRNRHVHVGWPNDPLALSNDLEAPVAARHPEVAGLIETCYREGAIAAAMSGSGSAVFALFSEVEASRAARRLRRAEWLVLISRTLPRREALRRIGL